MRLNVEINQYIKALNNKIIELELVYLSQRNEFIDIQYNSFLNKILKKSQRQLNKTLNSTLSRYKFNKRNIKNKINNLFYLKEVAPKEYLDKMSFLLNLQAYGEIKVQVDKTELEFVNKYEYETNSKDII